MEQYPLNESLWRRGWNDTKAIWTGWKFYVFDAVGAGLIAERFGFGWYWGSVVAILGMVGAWICATIKAPVKQRDEARALLVAKPKPVALRNRDELIRAIAEVRESTGKLLQAQEQLDDLEARSPNIVNTKAMVARDKACTEYNQAMDKFHAEILVAGEHYENLLHDLSGYISTQVWVKTAKPTFVGGDPQQFRILTALEYFGRIAGKVNEVRRKIDELSGQAPDKEGSQPE